PLARRQLRERRQGRPGVWLGAGRSRLDGRNQARAPHHDEPCEAKRRRELHAEQALEARRRRELHAEQALEARRRRDAGSCPD
ncbi:MAG: hypothetical protein LC777_22515, partial [Actinobacteria bacterium]|nr:hypothetical protein [Actinomycetota bacterium]